MVTASPGPPLPRTGPPPAAPRAAAAGESEIRRSELAGFLRSRRERIAPEQVGLPRGSRRRTPGLRREEVAQLSTVGVTWYTWLEQGRDIQVSVSVLDALARALMLDGSERAHLFHLAAQSDPLPGRGCETVTPAVRRLMEQLEPIPAGVQNSRYDILAYNRTYGRMLCALDEVPEEDLNCMVLAYLNPHWRAGIVTLQESTRAMAAKFRASMAEHLAEPAWKMLLDRLLTQSPEFREVWERHEVQAPSGKVKQYRNRDVGLLTVEHTELQIGPAHGPRLVTYVPVDDTTRARLERLLELALAAERGEREEPGER
ncbi:helix-turn-helix transcriptional regulator [Streptomyces sp. NPDC050560]|uniref:helix-turn-helix transcriptional regulator n=1 Tax=Streptomyces sp. NPDC050560 TaxID=3365630 RepID=UPI0037A47150